MSDDVDACPLCLGAPSPAAPSPAPQPAPCLLCRRTGLEPSGPVHPGGGLAPALGGGRVWGPRDGWVAAIEAAPAGGEVRLGPGTFRLPRALRLARDVAIVGAGVGRTVVEGWTPEPVLGAVGGGEVAIAGLTLRQRVGWLAQFRQEGRADLIAVEAGRLDVNGCAFDRLEAGVEPWAPGWYDKAGGTAIVVRGAASAAIVDCLFRPAQARGQDTTGVEARDEARVAVVNSRFERLHRGVVYDPRASLALAGCRFEDNAWGVDGMWAGDPDAPPAPPGAVRTVVGCAFTRNGLALLAAGAMPALVRGNTFERNEKAILVREVGARLEANVFRWNGRDVHAPVGGVS